MHESLELSERSEPIRDCNPNIKTFLDREPWHFERTLNGNHNWKHQNTSLDQNKNFPKFWLFQILLFDEKNIQSLIRIKMEYF